jgi:ATP-dependent DNA helicase RecG
VALSSPIRYIKGVGEARERAFSRLGVRTVEDLLFFFPRRYEDRRNITPLAALEEGVFASVVAQVVLCEKYSARKGFGDCVGPFERRQGRSQSDMV